MTNTVRVRFAPSPTGYLHIGGLRTALYNYLFTKHHDGKFILRIEDTDQSRYVEEAEQDIINSLKWSGIDIDEGPETPGEFGPYRQSERKEMYHTFAEQLIEKGQAYYAFDTTDELDQMRERLKKSGNPSPKYDAITRQSMKNSLTLPQEEVEKRLERGDEYVVRLKVPRRETVRFEDLIRGHVSFETKGLDDQVLLKSDGMPTYHLANVVDDHEMQISHVIRGEEWLSSTPKHVLLYNAFGWEIPQMAHLPLIMSPSGGKLSKRKAESEGIPINTKDYIDQNYEPEALVNFLAYLGWSPGDDSEIHSLDELIELFTMDRVSKGGAVFNHKKLLWYNEHYLREQPDSQIADRLKVISDDGLIDNVNDEYLKSAVGLLKERISKIEEILEMGRFFFEDPKEYDEKALKKWKDESAELVGLYKTEIEELSDFEAGNLKSSLESVINAKDVGFGKLMMPLRIAITGQGFGPDLFASMELLGKEAVTRRIDTALEKLG
ncbi:glutamate--tRNA ligase [Rhodohalobacter sulfatireducens]|uniref:Glutamate--tRNA ligase n=1 Tax=Rhodohalobacter sulfatireducens TaxID=2911366 RepID=A0ABS9K9N5_9BACT|nr:glutamate--tRNA ligase [Rhodohalobacter sulfatireducens]MCG2587561.1 glutamate--tRNA ligase [Rhodohalobacter sulfatireducens]